MPALRGFLEAMPSLADALYLKAPHWLQSAALSLYGLRLRRQRYGGVHPAELERLLGSQWWPGEELRRLQLDRLNHTLGLARQLPYYRDLPPGPLHDLRDLAQLPILEKDALRAMRWAPASGGGLSVHTGGTTGTPLTIYCDKRALQRNYAFFARFLSWAGIEAGARTATFAGRVLMSPDQKRPPFWRHNWAANTLLLSSYHLGQNTVEAYAEALARFRPALIDSYPSSLEPIARHVVATGRTDIRPRAIVTSSETLAPSVRALFTRAFSAPVFDYYGSAEMVAFISQCEQGSYHVNPEYGVVELVGPDGPVAPGEVGQVIATGFINTVMPLVRYRMGDLAALSERGCACGRHFPVIETIQGRLDDVVTTPDGRRIGRLDPIFKAVESIAEARIVQDRVDHIQLEYVAGEPLSDRERTELLAQLTKRIGVQMAIDIVRVPSIPRTNAGKLRTVENRVAAGRTKGEER